MRIKVYSMGMVVSNTAWCSVESKLLTVITCEWSIPAWYPCHGSLTTNCKILILTSTWKHSQQTDNTARNTVTTKLILGLLLDLSPCLDLYESSETLGETGYILPYTGSLRDQWSTVSTAISFSMDFDRIWGHHHQAETVISQGTCP